MQRPASYASCTPAAPPAPVADASSGPSSCTPPQRCSSGRAPASRSNTDSACTAHAALAAGCDGRLPRAPQAVTPRRGKSREGKHQAKRRPVSAVSVRNAPQLRAEPVDEARHGVVYSAGTSATATCHCMLLWRPIGKHLVWPTLQNSSQQVRGLLLREPVDSLQQPEQHHSKSADCICHIDKGLIDR